MKGCLAYEDEIFDEQMFLVDMAALSKKFR